MSIPSPPSPLDPLSRESPGDASTPENGTDASPGVDASSGARISEAFRNRSLLQTLAVRGARVVITAGLGTALLAGLGTALLATSGPGLVAAAGPGPTALTGPGLLILAGAGPTAAARVGMGATSAGPRAAHVTEAPHPDRSYRIEATPEDLRDRFTAEQIALLETLNRADAERMIRLDSLVLPDRWDREVLEHSPFPSFVSSLSHLPRALLVHQPLQVFGAFEDGRLVRWGPVSTGRREHPTPSGIFHLNWRSRGRESTVNPEWYLEWYFNFHNERGISFHQYGLPGEPASHACVRLLERDARWLFEWGEEWRLDERGWEVLEEGTPVRILGDYDFDAPPPWLDPDDPHPPVPPADLEAVGRQLSGATARKFLL